eukprot:CAMPEP_0171248008 /NCGR_PEP_ID=MMETSP0790-20130122/48795_1 /TAXON_ID=2925 /ORGANISM="Alexandrium catenella, Strain OF101" /LENGTH=118 /DNA_ID=CAMNT_0011715447 /DNA_START=37 /DNA_END=390 /DNA_ORIENTATION=+
MALIIQGLDGSVLGHLFALPWAPIALLAWVLAALLLARLADVLSARVLVAAKQRSKAAGLGVDHVHILDRTCEPGTTAKHELPEARHQAAAAPPAAKASLAVRRRRWADMFSDSEEEP